MEKKHMYDGNKEGTNSKKDSNIEKKIPILKKKIVKDAEGKNRMAKKSQNPKKQKKIPRSISKSPLAIYKHM